MNWQLVSTLPPALERLPFQPGTVRRARRSVLNIDAARLSDMMWRAWGCWNFPGGVDEWAE